VLIPVGCAVNFTDLSSGVPTEWTWTFEGGTPATSNEKHPSGIVYNTAGNFLVKLVIHNEYGADSVTKTGYIDVSDNLQPLVSFTANKNALCIGDVVRFTDQTQYCPSSWSWEFTPNTVTFLEGTHQNSQNPVVQFDVPGAYDVKLTAYNGTGSGLLMKTDYILNGGYGVPFHDDFEEGFNGKHWDVYNPDAYFTWDTITVPGQNGITKSAWINLYDYVGVNRRDQLISPAFDLSNLSGATLSFSHAYAQRATIKDSLVVFVSNDCGNSWTRMLSLGPDGTPNIFVTHDNMVDEFFPESADDWCDGSFGVSCYTVDLNAYAGQNNVKVMFESYNRRGNNLFLDDIMISPPVGTDEQTLGTERLRVYPNPTSGMVTVLLSGQSTVTQVGLYNLQGQLILEGSLSPETGYCRGFMNLAGLQRGVYYMKAVTRQEAHVAKIILE
jgi:PKD repeat protein